MKTDVVYQYADFNLSRCWRSEICFAWGMHTRDAESVFVAVGFVSCFVEFVLDKMSCKFLKLDWFESYMNYDQPHTATKPKPRVEYVEPRNPPPPKFRQVLELMMHGWRWGNIRWNDPQICLLRMPYVCQLFDELDDFFTTPPFVSRKTSGWLFESASLLLRHEGYMKGLKG